MEKTSNTAGWRRWVLRDGRMRPTMRVLLYPLWMFLNGLWLYFIPIIIITTTGIPQGLLNGPVNLVLSLIWVYTGTIMATRAIDKRSITELGLLGYRGWWWDVATGILLPVLLLGAMYLAATSTGWYVPAASSERGAFVIVLAVAQAIIFAVIGTLAMQGYVMRNLTDDWGAGTGLVVSGILFGILVALNLPDAGVLAYLNLILLGLWMGLAVQISGALWFPIAIYASLTFAQGVLFGLPVQGRPLIDATQTTIREPALLTGGSTGPESGLLYTMVMLAGIAATALWARLRRQLTAAPVVTPYVAPPKPPRHGR